ncbi:MAG: glycosyltransferase [Anaerolineales bacterium]
MNILYLSQLVPYPIDAGPKVRSYHVLEYLASAGHEITLVAFRRPNDQSKSLKHLEQFCSEIYTIPMVRSRLKDVWDLGKSTLLGRSFLIDRDSVKAMDQLISTLIRRQRYEAIHADQLWMAQYALRAQTQLYEQGLNTTLVMDQHNAVHLIPQRLADNEPNPLKRWVLEREARSMKRYELQACSQFDRVVWVSVEYRRII